MTTHSAWRLGHVNQMGLSAQAIAGIGHDYPHDPSDLMRYVNFCRGRYSTAELQKRMAGRSIEWDRLLPHWDALVQMLDDELHQGDGKMAPRTYHEMRRILADGEHCESCDGTGRGADCTKCKGTGRRSGGRCRAENCWSGADLCSACRGRGYIGGDR